ncbi:hypothetical protein DH2020_014119 [Rehmannia glutinosa]|uniref:Transmembrane protein n=1 Tax=Rehmannia glutinosa TaxID=99300 RepID=A0ABR0WYW2_REHGL
MELFTILNESIKLLPKNGKLMAFIAIFSVVLSSSIFLLFSYILQSLVIDMFVTSQQSFMPDPNSFADPSSLTPQTGFSPAQIIGPLRHLQEDSSIILAVEIAFIFALSVISFFSTISTILVSSLSYNSKNSSPKEIFSMIARKWTRPLITTLYVSCLAIGYFFVVLLLATPLLMYRNKATLSVAILLGIVAFVFYLYLSVSWALAIVVSVVEESCYGIEALGKAGALVKGKRLIGFLLNVCFVLVTLIVFLGYMIILGKKWLGNPIIYGLLVLIFLSLVKILRAVAYAVLYFRCKVHHGEEVELHGGVEYSKLPTTQLANDMP